MGRIWRKEEHAWQKKELWIGPTRTLLALSIKCEVTDVEG